MICKSHKPIFIFTTERISNVESKTYDFIKALAQLELDLEFDGSSKRVSKSRDRGNKRVKKYVVLK